MKKIENMQLVPIELTKPMRTVLIYAFERAANGECFLFTDFWIDLLKASKENQCDPDQK